MTDYRFGIKNQPMVFYVYLPDMSALPNLRVNPTLAVGDVVVFKDDVSNGNITTLPVVTPAGSRRVKVSLSADEMNCDHTGVQFIDQTAIKEWADHAVEIANGLNRIDDLAVASTALSTAVWTNAKAAFLDSAVSGVAAAVWTVGSRTLTGFGTLAADVWAYANRTLTQMSSQLAAILASSTITVHRGDSLSVAFVGITAYTGWSKLWFTVKASVSDIDTNSTIMIVLSSPGDAADGLLYLNGTAATSTDGSITADDAALGNLTVALVADATDELLPGSSYKYDVQALIGTTVTTLATGSLTVTADVTRAIS